MHNGQGADLLCETFCERRHPSLRALGPLRQRNVEEVEHLSGAARCSTPTPAAPGAAADPGQSTPSDSLPRPPTHPLTAQGPRPPPCCAPQGECATPLSQARSPPHHHPPSPSRHVSSLPSSSAPCRLRLGAPAPTPALCKPKQRQRALRSIRSAWRRRTPTATHVTPQAAELLWGWERKSVGRSATGGPVVSRRSSRRPLGSSGHPPWPAKSPD